MSEVRHIVFDIGNVLLKFERGRPYRELIPDPGARERFLGEVCTLEWHLALDAGAAIDPSIEALCRKHPEQAALIRAYKTRWLDMLPGSYEDTVAILERLVAAGHDVTALTNFNHDLFALTVPAFPFLRLFRGATVSGEVRLMKPDPEIYAHHAERFGLEPGATLFFDDSPPNVEAARAAGWRAEVFSGAEGMRRDLARHGIGL